jgi:hypothetical protein
MGLIISKIKNHNLICKINFKTKYNLFGNKSKKKKKKIKTFFFNNSEYYEFKNFG